HSVDLRMWQFQVPALLEAGYRAVRYDVRGHGRSMVPPTGYTWEDYAADLADLLDRLNIERPATEALTVDAAHVVGLSMGGGIALQFALDFPGRVLSLTLVDSALPGFTYSEEFSAQIQALVQAVRDEGAWPAFRRLWLTHPLFEGLRRHPDRFALVEEMVRGFQAPEYRGQATASEGSSQPQIADRLAEIKAPVLVVAGDADIPDFRLIADILAANLPTARHVVLPGCGHVPPLEDPDAFNAALIAFLSEVSARPPPP
ncbi:MAG TPA: alpha/beta fold hydrolase, partial [Dehalococcoidia bacterium]|nr:alpha/beta fold hydrolase [Dehalococcoidia bacterium]